MPPTRARAARPAAWTAAAQRTAGRLQPIIPEGAATLTLSGRRWVKTVEDASEVFDEAYLEFEGVDETVAWQALWLTNRDVTSGWVAFEASTDGLDAVRGKTITFVAYSRTDPGGKTSFFLDSLRLVATCGRLQHRVSTPPVHERPGWGQTGNPMAHSNATPALSAPTFLYGTAWKEARTLELTRLALELGFRGIDTANQRKHYHEAAVGAALSDAIATRLVSRADVFLQTKFTFSGGQDHRLPYDPKADYASQVQQSFQSSLEHLSTDYVDSYVLHGPFGRSGLAAPDYEAWSAMEQLCRSGQAHRLGVSNVSLEQLRLLCDRASIPPALVQNRCYARQGWDRKVRQFCREHAIAYQGFSLLTANRSELSTPRIQEIAKRSGRPLPAVVFRFALDVGIFPLTGTSSAEHMQSDLACVDLVLSEQDRNALESLAQTG